MTEYVETYTGTPESAFAPFIHAGIYKDTAREIFTDIYKRRKSESCQRTESQVNSIDVDTTDLNADAKFYESLDSVITKLQRDVNRDIREQIKTTIDNEIAKFNLSISADISIADADTTQVLEALSDTRWDFRTIHGISKQTGLSKERVANILNQNKHKVRKSLVPNKRGGTLYTLISHKKSWREIASELRLFITKST